MGYRLEEEWDMRCYKSKAKEDAELVNTQYESQLYSKLFPVS